MRKEKITTSYIVLSRNELTAAQKSVLDAAENAVKSAYSPYSAFQVGAAIIMDDGQVIIGNNQENAVYPLGLCAERVALFSMGVGHPNGKPQTMAIAIASENKPGFPCGSCRQAIIEFEQRYQTAIEILIEGKNGEYLLFESVKALLPFAFDHENLK